MENDWRLDGNEHMNSQTLRFKKYADRTTSTDHDHCEFCWTKFSTEEPESLIEGYTTEDDYRWVCPTCFEDFKERFQFVMK